MKKYLFFVTVLLTSLVVSSQNRPKWIKSTPTSESGAYDYFVGRGANDNEAYDNVVDAICKKRCVNDLEGQVKRTVKSGDGGRKIELDRNVQVSCDCGSDLYIRKVKEHIDRDGYYLLVSVSSSEGMSGRSLEKSNFVWRSALAPGWGQFYNKEPNKGLLFSLGTVGLLGGTLFSFGQASNSGNNADLALLNGNIAQFNSARKTQKNWNTTGTIFGVGAAALWVLNIIDATSSEKNLYAMRKDKGFGILASGDRVGLKFGF